jgi:hypothetical protein
MTGIIVPDGGTIGSASDTDAISIASDGNVTASKDLTITGKTTLSGDLVPATPLSHRNMIINGAMQVWQRGTSSTTLSNGNTYVPDRFNCRAGVGSGHTAIHSTDVPTTGEASFSNSLKFTVGTGASLSAGNGNNYLYYAMEGYDSNPTRIGTAYAKIMTISFWVKASVTGVYGFAVTNDDNAHTYAGSYTVSSTDWEKHTITIPASGAGGTWYTNNARAITLLWNWGAGSDFIASSAGWATADDRGGVDAGSSIHLVDGTHNGATWYITGVQLELGSVATPFEHKSYAEELARCQRYYCQGRGSSNDIEDASSPTVNFPVAMRSGPDVSISDYTGNSGKMSRYGGTQCTVSGVAATTDAIFLIQHNSESANRVWFLQYVATAEI